MDMQIAAWFAAALVFITFFMRSMASLRLVAIASNAAFILYALLGLRYGIFEMVLPIFVLHTLLLPLNALRLHELTRSAEGFSHGGACRSRSYRRHRYVKLSATHLRARRRQCDRMREVAGVRTS